MGTENWRKYPKARMLKAIKDSGGNISLVMKRLSGKATKNKCSRMTIKKAMEEDPDIAQAMKDAEEDLGDLVEAKLVQHIKEGNVTSAIFYAKTKLKNRGYVESVITHQGESVPTIIDDVARFNK